jgi:hypothetical protein
MRGAIPPSPNTNSRRGVRLKHRDKFTFTLYPYMGDRPVAGQQTAQHRKMRTSIRFSGGFRTHDPSIRVVQYISALGREATGAGLFKVKLSLCLTEHHDMKAYGGSECIAPRFLC